jgi:phage-related protein
LPVTSDPKRPPGTGHDTLPNRRGGRTQAVYYRDPSAREPVKDWVEDLIKTKPAAAAKIEEHLREHLNGRPADDPPPKHPITSQIEGNLRELRVRFAGTRYRLLYQRSRNLVIILHGFEKNTGAIPDSDKKVAKKRFVDFKARMNAEQRLGPRAAGHDAPLKRGIER